jgi:sugar phosphate isomerase/epimerase
MIEQNKFNLTQKEYSLVHLTEINCPPPEFIRVAFRTGYDSVSLRTIPMRLAGEIPHDIARNRELFQETKKALDETGIRFNDIENARIFEGVDVKDYEPDLEAAAELGIKHVLSNIWTPDKIFYTEKFSELCELANQYGQTVNVEFVTWSSLKNMREAKELLVSSRRHNVGIVVDALHFYRSRVPLEEFDSMPKEWFNFIHLCDAEKEIPTEEDALIHTGRSERLYPGEGAINMKGIVEKIPHVVRGIEIPHFKRVKEYGFEEHARTALLKAKEYFGDY